MIHDLSIAAAGAVLFGHLVVSLFFLRFWQQTRARLFACFAAAFLVLAIERAIILTAVTEPIEMPLIYLTRLAAFLIIIAGIWDANRSRP